MGVIQSIDGCLEEAIGAHGLSHEMLEAWVERLAPHLANLKKAYAEKKLPLLHVPEQQDDIAPAEEALKQLSEGAKTLIFFGTGGSSLGGQAIAQLGGWFIPGEKTKDQNRRPRVRFYDNLDPRTLERALASLDLATTRFVVTSKSGGTAETLTQAIVALRVVKDAGLAREIPKIFLGVSEPAVPDKINGLRTLFEEHNIPLLDHNPGVGGRYAGLTNVGLLPALAVGLDVRALRAGARQVIQTMLSTDVPESCPPALGAAVAIALTKEKSVANMVLMPYSDRLGRLASWYVQLWAESLGKNGEGTMPVAALGPVDQHSQLQLYMDGPPCHMVTLLRTDCEGTGPEIDADLARVANFDYMAGRRVGDLVTAQQDAIAQSLIKAGRAVRTFDVKPLDEQALGGLMMHFMLETIFAAGLLGVDPFDQPAVEMGKQLARESLAQGGS